MATEQSVLAVIRASRPTFRNPYDKVTFALHASFLSAGFLLHAAGPTAFADDVLSTCSSEEVGIENWNEFEDNYAFVYSTPEKGKKKLLVKCLSMNDNLLVDALKEGDSEPIHLEINVKDYVEENGGPNYSSHFNNLGKLVKLFDKEILQKLDRSPKANSSGQGSSSEGGGPRENRNQPPVVVNEPDETTIPSPFFIPPIPAVGGSDLFPGPGAGVYPVRAIGGGSMLVGPNDPRFFGGIGGGPALPGGQPGVPPGARFDPYGPPGVPGFEPGRFIRDPRRNGGRTHPDLEHFRGGSDFI